MIVVFFGLASSVLTFLLGGWLWTLVLVVLMVALGIAALVRTLIREHRARMSAESRVLGLQQPPPTDGMTAAAEQNTQVGAGESSALVITTTGLESHPPATEPTSDSGAEVTAEVAKVAETVPGSPVQSEQSQDPVELAHKAAVVHNAGEVARLLKSWIAEASGQERPERESLLAYYMVLAGKHGQVTVLHRLADSQPTSSLIAYRLALALEFLGEKQQAADELAARLPTLKRKQSLRLHEARLRRAIGEPAVALDLARKVLDDPKVGGTHRHDALVEEGYALGALGKRLEGIASFERALEIDPSDTGVRFHIAYECSQLQLKSVALTHYEVLESQGEIGVSTSNLGAALHDLGLPILGTDKYLRAANDGVAIACGNLAHKLLDAGFVGEAKRWIAEGARLDQTDRRVVGAAGRVESESESEHEKLASVESEGLKLRDVIKSFDARADVELPQGRFVTEAGDPLDFQIDGVSSKAMATDGWHIELRSAGTLLILEAKKGLLGTSKGEGWASLQNGQLIGYMKDWPTKGRMGIFKAARST